MKFKKAAYLPFLNTNPQKRIKLKKRQLEQKMKDR